MDPMRFLESEDPIELAMMLAISDRYFRLRRDLDQQLATMIINKLAEAWKG